jgi:hypothetical protein
VSRILTVLLLHNPVLLRHRLFIGSHTVSYVSLDISTTNINITSIETFTASESLSYFTQAHPDILVSGSPIVTTSSTISRGAMVISKRIPIQWQSTDKVVLDWLSSLNASTSSLSTRYSSNGNSTFSNLPHKTFAGTIAGAVIASILTLLLILFSDFMFLK